MSKDELGREELDKWLITAMSYMKTIYEDNGIPWSIKDEAIFQQIRQLIERQVEVDEAFIEKYAIELVSWMGYPVKESPGRIYSLKSVIAQMLQEAGVKIKK